jgi:hypothetical protein
VSEKLTDRKEQNVSDIWLHSEPVSSSPPSDQSDPHNRYSLAGLKEYEGVKTWHVTEADAAEAAD